MRRTGGTGKICFLAKTYRKCSAENVHISNSMMADINSQRGKNLFSERMKYLTEGSEEGKGSDLTYTGALCPKDKS